MERAKVILLAAVFCTFSAAALSAKGYETRPNPSAILVSSHPVPSGGGGGGGCVGCPLAVLQSTGNTYGGGDSITVTATNTVTSGSMIVCGAINDTQGGLANGEVTDNYGNTYQIQVSADISGANTGIFISSNVTGGSNFAITYNPPVAVTGFGLACSELQGATIPNGIDKTDTATGNSTSPSGNLIHTSQKTAIFGFLNCASGDRTISVGAGYDTLYENENGTYSVMSWVAKIVASGDYQADWSINSAAPWVVDTLALKGN